MEVLSRLLPVLAHAQRPPLLLPLHVTRSHHRSLSSLTLSVPSCCCHCTCHQEPPPLPEFAAGRHELGKALCSVGRSVGRVGKAAWSQAMTRARGLASTRTLPTPGLHTVSQRRVLSGCYTPHDPSCCLLLTSWSLVFAAARKAGSTETRRPCAPRPSGTDDSPRRD